MKDPVYGNTLRYRGFEMDRITREARISELTDRISINEKALDRDRKELAALEKEEEL